MWPGWRPTHFVTVVSGSPDLAVLGPLVVGAGRCLLLYTSEDKRMEELAVTVQGRLKEHDVRCEQRPFALADLGSGMAKGMAAHIAPFLSTARSSADVVFDITPGKKPMTVVVDHLAPAGSWLVYMEHEFARDRKPTPGTELIVRRPAADALAARLVMPGE